MSDVNRAGFSPSATGSLFVGLYGWVVAASFGAVVLDIVYSRTIDGILDSAQAVRVFSEVSDFLLMPLALTAIAAIGAVGFSGKSRSATSLIIASVVAVFAQISAYALLGPLLAELQIGTWVRIGLSGAASILAIAGMSRFYRAPRTQ